MQLHDKPFLKSIKGIVLDMDGIIIDSEPIHMDSFRILMKELNLSYEENFLTSMVGYPVENNLKKVLDTYNINPFSLEDGVKYREELYIGLLNKTALHAKEGIPELISLCKAHKIKIGLASSSTRRQINIILKGLSVTNSLGLDFSKCFDSIMSGDDVAHKKPAPEIYEKSVKNLGFSPSDCLSVEDSPAGITSATTAGLFCGAVRTEFTIEEQLVKADFIMDSVNELATALQEIFSNKSVNPNKV